MQSSAVEILIAEDNPDDLELALEVLTQHRVASRIHTVKDGAEALDFLFSRGAYSERQPRTAPKVVLLDLKLPLVDGLEVLRQIKADPTTRRIPVVVLTSSREERDVVESYDLGANSYVVRPVDFDEFTQAIGELGRYWTLLNESPAS